MMIEPDSSGLKKVTKTGSGKRGKSKKRPKENSASYDSGSIDMLKNKNLVDSVYSGDNDVKKTNGSVDLTKVGGLM